MAHQWIRSDDELTYDQAMDLYYGAAFVDDFSTNRFVVVPRDHTVVPADVRVIRWHVWDQQAMDWQTPHPYVRESSAQAVADRLNLMEREAAA